MEGATKLVSTVAQLAGEEYWQLHGVGRQVAGLRDELATMNAILRMHSEADDGDVDHFVREWTKQVRELACDAEDCIDLYVFRIRSRRGAGVLVRSGRILATLFSRRTLAGDINGLCARAVAISERHARYGVNREALRRAPFFAPVSGLAESARALRRRAANGNGPDELVGIRGQANTLAGKVEAVSTDERLKVFSIVGFGGLGKTTLAMEVCRQLEPAFQRLALVSVSQAFDGRKEDVEGLLKRVVRQIGRGRHHERGTGPRRRCRRDGSGRAGQHA